MPIRWTVDTLGWQGTAGHISAAVVVSRVLAAARPGEIVLMHAGSNPDDHTTLDADALPRVISELRARGYSPRNPRRAYRLSTGPRRRTVTPPAVRKDLVFPNGQAEMRAPRPGRLTGPSADGQAVRRAAG